MNIKVIMNSHQSIDDTIPDIDFKKLISNGIVYQSENGIFQITEYGYRIQLSDNISNRFHQLKREMEIEKIISK